MLSFSNLGEGKLTGKLSLGVRAELFSTMGTFSESD